MVELLTQLAPEEGYHLSRLADVRFLRSNRALTETPVLYEPGIVVVVQGRKRGFLGGQTYLYDAQHYLAVSVPVPFTMETDASAKAPLALKPTAASAAAGRPSSHRRASRHAPAKASPAWSTTVAWMAASGGSHSRSQVNG